MRLSNKQIEVLNEMYTGKRISRDDCYLEGDEYTCVGGEQLRRVTVEILERNGLIELREPIDIMGYHYAITEKGREVVNNDELETWA